MTTDIKNFHERELHPFLNYYLNKVLGIAAKTIFQEKSTNSVKGENEWVHPDMVGFTLLTSKWNEKVVNMCEHYYIPKVIISSFELKKEITMSNLREVFFQTVSNSSWANEGYLVAVQIDTEDEKLMQKINRLSNSFGIGIIHLNLEQPEKSKILFEAKRKETIDGETVNHLFEINQDFREFVKAVEDSLKINSIVKDNLDELRTKKQLEEILKKGTEAIKEKNEESTIKVENIVGNKFDWKTSVTGKKPSLLSIKGDNIPVSTWKDLLVNVCIFFSKIDKERFENVVTELKGKKRVYFSKNKEDLRAPYYIEDTGYFLEVNLSAESIVKLVQKIVNGFDYEKDDIVIYFEEQK